MFIQNEGYDNAPIFHIKVNGGLRTLEFGW